MRHEYPLDHACLGEIKSFVLLVPRHELPSLDVLYLNRLIDKGGSVYSDSSYLYKIGTELGTLSNVKFNCIDQYYDMASQATAAIKILSDVTEMVKSINNRILRDAFDVNIGSQLELDSFPS